jgi:methenyltetrahydromethanopterin cyclohydrolase
VIRVADTYTLTASATGLTSDTSTSFVVSPAAATQLAYVTEPTNTTAGVDIPSFTVEVLDAFNNRVTSATNAITLTVASGSGPIFSGTNPVSAVSGLATFSDIVIRVADTYTLTASATGLTSDTSTSFVVSPAAATQLAYVTEPTDTTAGSNIPVFTVEVLDAYNNRVTSATNAITLTVASGSGPIFSGTNPVSAVSGLATFSDIVIRVADTYTLTASATGLTSDTSTSFVVNPAAVNKLAIGTAVPANTTAGATMATFTIEVHDQYDNLVTGATNNVSLSLSSSSFASGTTSKAAVAGVATFDDVVITDAGSYTIDATSAGLTSITTASFNINPAAADRLAIGTAVPANTTAGATMATFTIEIHDQYDNLVTGATNNVSLALSSSSFASGTTSKAAVAGVATFDNVVITDAGSYTIDATSAGLTSITTASFNINPAAADRLAIGTAVPANTTAGATMATFTIEIHDQYNNLVTGATNSVSLALSSSAFASGTTSKAAVAGVATFDDVVITDAGTYTIDATSAGLTSVTTASFNINPAAADRLAIGTAVPANTTAGATMATFTIEIHDQYNNLVTGATNSVSLALSSSSFASGTTSKAAVAGVATFDDVVITDAGTYTIDATSAGLTSITTASFNINPAAADRLAIGTAVPANTIAGATMATFTIEIHDQYNNLVTGATNSVSLALSSSSFASGTTSKAAVAGVATFDDVVITDAGTYTIDATSAGLTSITTASFNINPAAADRLAIGTAVPANTTAGATMATFTIEIHDQYDNLVTSATNSVSLALSSSAFASGTTSKAAVAGVATFDNIVITDAGTYTIDATSAGLTSITTASFNINPAAADRLAIGTAVPANTTAGATMATFTIEIHDQYNNLVTGATNSVSLALSSSSFASGTTSKAAVAGVATFDDVVITDAGTYTIDATSAGLTSVTTASFNINPAAANKLAIGTAVPANTTAGATMATFTIEIHDQYDNLVTSATNSVSLALSSSAFASGTTSKAAVAGVATFDDVVITDAGTYTIDATSAGLTSVTTASFNINPAAADRLAIGTAVPANTTAGATMATFTIEIHDQYNNLVTGATNSVSLALSSSAFASGTTSKAAVAGVATFDDVVITDAGTYTIDATSAGLTSITTASFNINPAAANKLAIGTAVPANTTAGATMTSFTIEILDQYDNLVTGATNSVSLALSSSAFASGTTSKAAVAGVATFDNVVITDAGSYTIDATSAGLTSITTASFNINPAAADRLAIGTAVPANTTAGATMATFTIEIHDQYNNLVTGATNSVSLALSSSAFASGTTSKAAVAGVATFDDVVITDAGTYTIDATSAGLTSITTASFNINPAAANKLAIGTAVPANTTAGATMATFTIEVHDQYNNLVTGATNSVSLALSSSAFASGTTSKAAVAGVATFDDVVITDAGSYTIDATSAGLTSVTTASFNINPAAASYLVFSSQPAGGAAGSNQLPEVESRDVYGNLRTNDSTTEITLSIFTNPGGSTLSGTANLTLSSGVATWTSTEALYLNRTGTGYVLRASDGTRTVNSNPFNITHAAANSLVFTLQPTTTAAGDDILVNLELRDTYSNVVTTGADASASVTLSKIAGSGTLDGTLSKNLSAGTVSFGATEGVFIDLAGTDKQLRASDGTRTVDSSVFTITNAAASQLVYTTQPSDTVAGQTISLALEILDQYNNLVTTGPDATGSITLELISGTGPLLGTLTKSASAGVISFAGAENVRLNLTGTKVIRAALGAITVSSDSFSITPAATNGIEITAHPSASIVAGQPITLSARIFDSFNNTITSGADATANVTVTLQSGTGTLLGTNVKALSGGTVSFAAGDNLRLDLVGSKTLRATMGAFTADTNSFSITAASASRLAFSTQPSSTATTNVNFATQPAVQVQDVFGNLITGATNSITLAAFSGSNCTGTPDGTLSATTNPLSATAGTATFAGVRHSAAETIYIQATAAGLTSACSNAVAVSATSLLTRKGQAAAAATSITIPTHVAGDLLIMFAYANGTAAPVLPAGWIEIGNKQGATPSTRVAYRTATGSGTASGTWTNASHLIAVVYEGQHASNPIGSFEKSEGSSATISYPALTLSDTSGNSRVIAFASHNGGATNNTQTPPTGMTNYSSQGTGPKSAFHETTSAVATWAGGSVGVTANSAWSSWSLEVRSEATPGEPGTPVYTNVNTTTLTVNWAPASTGGSAGTYRVERAPDVAGSPGAFTQIGTTTNTFYNDTGLTAGTTYWYRVRSQNYMGNGPYSVASSVFTSAAPPIVVDWRTATDTATWTVPAGVTSITVKTWGAGGGGGAGGLNRPGGTGGGGAFAQTTLSVTPGETLLIRVGGGGDGGTVASGGPNRSGSGGGGGGFTGVFRTSVSQVNALIVVGAGGGGGGGDTEASSPNGGAGGAGGPPDGSTGSNGSENVTGGTGGTQSAGGAGGSGGGGTDGAAGGALAGGSGGGAAAGGLNGGGNGANGGARAPGGGGGGAGYFGGGSGGTAPDTTESGAGGGGGASFATGSNSFFIPPSGSQTANTTDSDYVAGRGNGGAGGAAVTVGTAGQSGLIVITY